MRQVFVCVCAGVGCALSHTETCVCASVCVCVCVCLGECVCVRQETAGNCNDVPGVAIVAGEKERKADFTSEAQLRSGLSPEDQLHFGVLDD